MKLDNPVNALKLALKLTGEAWVKIRGRSMEPLISQGDIVKVVPVDSLAPGDVVVFEYKGQLTCHTVIKVRNGYFFTQGENSGVVEGPFPKDHILGKVSLSAGASTKLFPKRLRRYKSYLLRLFRKF